MGLKHSPRYIGFIICSWSTISHADIDDLFSLSLQELSSIQISSRKRIEDSHQSPASTLIWSNSLTPDSLNELVARSPGIVANADNILEPNIFMRGAGNDIESASANNAVGLFIDTIYQPRSSGFLIPTFDLSQIEILRGPQGIFYGKNVNGGLINLITNKPEDANYSRVAVSQGSYQQQSIEAIVNAKLAANSKGRLALYSSSHDGYALNTYTDNDVEQEQHYALRAHLMMDLSKDSSLLLSADHYQLRANGHWIDIKTPSANNVSFTNPDPRRGPNNTDGHREADIRGVSAVLKHHGAWGEWSATTAIKQASMAHLNNDAGSYIDFSKLPTDITTGRVDFASADFDPNSFNDDYFINSKQEEIKSLTQEINYWGHYSDSVSFLLGAFYMYEEVERTEAPEYLFGQFYSQGTELNLSQSNNSTIGIFGELDLHLTEQLKTQLGLRYTRDKKDIDVYRQVQGDPLGASLTNAEGRVVSEFTAGTNKSWSAFTPSLSLQWQANRNWFAYLSLSQGFRSGGWNEEGATSPQEALLSYNEELASSLELGNKIQLPDHSATLSLSLFHTRYDDLQTQQFVRLSDDLSGKNLIGNASRASVTGLELHYQQHLSSRISVIADYSLSYSNIDETLIETQLNYDPGCDCNLSTEIDLKGNELRRTPKHSARISTDSLLWESKRRTLHMALGLSYTGDYYFDNQNSARTKISAYQLIDLALTYRPKTSVIGQYKPNTMSQWQIVVWAKNLNNEQYETSITDVIDSVLVAYAPPRTAGLSIKWEL
jgi:iron complex outermembrane receptor protein